VPYRLRHRSPVGRRNSDSGSDQAIPKLDLTAVRHAASKSHRCHSPRTMFRKQVSRPVNSLDPPSWPPRRSRSSELEERPGHGPDPGFLCPTASTTVGPLATHELSVPAKDGLRPDHERSPSVPGDRPARRGEEGPIPVAKLRPADRTSEHLHLVAEDGVLELEL
jgi:hypothetical protein